MCDRLLFALSHYSVLALVAIAAYVVGGACLRKVLFESRLESTVFRMSLGLGIVAYAVFVIGLIRFLYAWLVWTLLLVCLVIFVIGQSVRLKDIVTRLRSFRMTYPKGMGLPDTIGILIIVALLVQSLVMPLYPPVRHDATSYHFAVAKHYATSHSVDATPYLRYPVAPEISGMLFTLALLIQDDITAQQVSCLMMILCAAALYSWGRRMFSSRTGFFAAMLFLSCPLVLYLGSSGQNDMALALFVTLAAYALLNWRADDESAIWLAVSAVFLGFAAGSKCSALFFIPIFSFCIAVSGQKNYRLALAAGFLLISLLVCAPWYVRSYLYTGNPVFPFASGLFKMRIWNPADASGMLSDLSRYGAGKSVTAFILLPWNLTFRQQYFHSDGFIAPFMILSPLLTLFFFQKRHATTLAFIAFSYLLFWFASVQVLRYLMPVIPMFILLSAYLLVQWPKEYFRLQTARCVTCIGVVAVLVMALPGLAQVWYHALERGPYPTNPKERSRYLAQRVPGFSAIEFLNRNFGRNYTVYALFGEHLAYFADGKFRGDWFGPARYSRVLKYYRSPERMCQELITLGVTYLLVVKRSKFSLPTSEATWRHFKTLHSDSWSVLYKLSCQTKKSAEFR